MTVECQSSMGKMKMNKGYLNIEIEIQYLMKMGTCEMISMKHFFFFWKIKSISYFMNGDLLFIIIFINNAASI